MIYFLQLRYIFIATVRTALRRVRQLQRSLFRNYGSCCCHLLAIFFYLLEKHFGISTVIFKYGDFAFFTYNFAITELRIGK